MLAASSESCEPYFTIIIPAFNAGKYLSDTVLSVLNQEFRDFELIVVDDNSTDNTRNEVLAFMNADARIKLLTNTETKGPNYSRNRGISEAKGKYILFVDSDDQIYTSALHVIQDNLQHDEAEIISFGFEFKQDGRVFKRSNHYTDVLKGDAVTEAFFNGKIYSVCWNKAYSLQFIKQNRIGFIEDLNHGRDTIFTLDCVSSARKIKFISQTLYISMVREASFSRSFSLKNVESLIKNLIEIQKRAERYNISVHRLPPFFAKHIRYIILLAAFRLPDYSSFRKSLNTLKSSGFYSNIFAVDTFKKMRLFDWLLTSLLLVPAGLYVTARTLNKLNLRPY